MTKNYDYGYIAMARSVFDHGILNKRPHRFSWLEAWLWLIGQAAWKAEGRRGKFGVVHVARGQLCGTLRSWGKLWGWPKSNVDRFLRRLAEDKMIKRYKLGIGTSSGTGGGSSTRFPVLIITICNYDKFQQQSRRTIKKGGQVAGQQAGQLDADAIVARDLFGVQPLNQTITKESKKVAQGKNRTKPRHGAKGRGMVWFDHGSAEWELYAADFHEATGSIKLPEAREGGKGNWFKWAGETRKSA